MIDIHKKTLWQQYLLANYYQTIFRLSVPCPLTFNQTIILNVVIIHLFSHYLPTLSAAISPSIIYRFSSSNEWTGWELENLWQGIRSKSIAFQKRKKGSVLSCSPVFFPHFSSKYLCLMPFVQVAIFKFQFKVCQLIPLVKCCDQMLSVQYEDIFLILGCSVIDSLFCSSACSHYTSDWCLLGRVGGKVFI